LLNVSAQRRIQKERIRVVGASVMKGMEIVRRQMSADLSKQHGQVNMNNRGF
jgi:hypothetical protein